MLGEQFGVLVVSSLNHGTQFKFQCEERWTPNDKLNGRFKLKLKSILETLSSLPFCQSHNNISEAVDIVRVGYCISDNVCTCQETLFGSKDDKQEKEEKCDSEVVSFCATGKNSLRKIIKRRTVSSVLFDDTRYNTYVEHANANKNSFTSYNYVQRPEIETLSRCSTLDTSNSNPRIEGNLDEWLDNVLNIRGTS